ncbi:putative transmembrane protein [Favolaschia claudopus]|uniref:Transmembrane protein n=1 Tax=Favolaschia claudopus TaxID=2862362 RepID=A0AAV9ZXX5_9AGAR
MSDSKEHYLPQYTAVDAQEERPRRSPLRRFALGFLLAFGIWASLKAIASSRPLSSYRPPCQVGYSWVVPSSITLGQCLESDDSLSMLDGTTSADAVFNIPLNADSTIHLSHQHLSRWFGSVSALSGTLHITSSSQLENDKARIIIERGSRVKACRLTGKNGETGVGLIRGLTSSSSPVKLTLVLPQTGTPLQLKGILVDLPNFALNIGDLKDVANFESAIFKTSNSPVIVESLTAEHTQLQTSNAHINIDNLVSSDLRIETSDGGISGTYNSSGTLHLTTSNAPIRVTVNLEHESSSTPPKVVMRTSNELRTSEIDAKVNLYATGDDSNTTSPGTFTISALTSNGPLSLGVPTSPGNSALRLAARTSNRPAEVKLHSAYQGAFAVRTSNEEAGVHRVDGGDGRKVELREGEGEGGGKMVRGYVYMAEENRELGRVRVVSSNAPVDLYI